MAFIAGLQSNTDTHTYKHNFLCISVNFDEIFTATSGKKC